MVLKIIREIMHFQHKKFIIPVLLSGDWEVYFYIVYSQSFLYSRFKSCGPFLSLLTSHFIIIFINKST